MLLALEFTKKIFQVVFVGDIVIFSYEKFTKKEKI